MIEYISEHRRGLIGTIVTHIILLILLMMFGFFTPLPLPEEEGVLVDFGNSENGFGMEEPAPSDMSQAKNQEEIRPEVKTPPPPPQREVKAAAQKEPVVTQDIEKTAVVPSAKKKATEKPKDPEKEKIEKEKLQQEKLEKQRLAEADRQRQAEIDKKKREEEQRLAQIAADEKKANEINNRAKNAFGGAGMGTADSKSTSQGATYGPGNQGNPQGSANVGKYGPGGGVGAGVSFNLDGRSALTLPKPEYPGNEEGLVVVQVTVNKAGSVTKAEPGVKGSNTTDPGLVAAAKKAALHAKFNVSENAPEFQIGTITYRFLLD